MNIKKQNGFTLIELMIVIAIIAILAAIALPAYQDYIAKSQLSEAMVLSDGVKTPVLEYYSQNATCPANGTGGVAATITGKYVASVVTGGAGGTTGGCTITATMAAANVSAGVLGKTVIYTLVAAPTVGSFNWTCVSTALQKYVPSACTGA